jgi:hypothetical protein
MPRDDQQDEHDRKLIEQAGSGTTEPDRQSRSALAELIVGLRNAMTSQRAEAERLGNKIWWLNFWLLAFTIVIALRTAALVWTEFRK